MNYYLDVEYTDFNGEAISLALVPEDDNIKPLYLVMEYQGQCSEWVYKNVIPYMGDEPIIKREEASIRISNYVIYNGGKPNIVADWPEDFVHFSKLLIVSAGRMVNMPEFSMDYKTFYDFNVSKYSKIPHNALEDAKALKYYCNSKMS